MRTKDPFLRTTAALAVPVALQSMLQASFSIVDQLMIGQLGSVSVAGVGLAGKFSSIYSVLVSAIGAVAGIMIAQYLGLGERREVRRSFFYNLYVALGLGALFAALCALFPARVMGLYSRDAATVDAAADYLAVLGWGFLPTAGATLLSTLFRCLERPRLPLYASLVSAVLNTGLNWVLIFGKLGCPALGARGAAIATVVSQWVNAGLMLAMLRRKELLPASGENGARTPFGWGRYLAMLAPILVCEAAWSLGENVYAMIYGHMGTAASAAMTLTNPVQSLVIGALCGLSQAAGVIVGKRLGAGDEDGAYHAGKRLMWYGLWGAVALSVLVAAFSPVYVRLYPVEVEVRALTVGILRAYALIAPVKVLNMILGGGVLRSGGKTNYVMAIDMAGTWCFGVPLGLLGAFVLGWGIPYVYFLLSLEELVRLVISLLVFRKRRWMRRFQAA